MRLLEPSIGELQKLLKLRIAASTLPSLRTYFEHDWPNYFNKTWVSHLSDRRDDVETVPVVRLLQRF